MKRNKFKLIDSNITKENKFNLYKIKKVAILFNLKQIKNF